MAQLSEGNSSYLDALVATVRSSCASDNCYITWCALFKEILTKTSAKVKTLCCNMDKSTTPVATHIIPPCQCVEPLAHRWWFIDMDLTSNSGHAFAVYNNNTEPDRWFILPILPTRLSTECRYGIDNRKKQNAIYNAHVN